MKIRSKQSPVITDIFLSSIFLNGGIFLALLSVCFLVINFIRAGSSSQLISVLFCLIFLALGLLLAYQGIKIKHQIHILRIYVSAMQNDCHITAIAQAASQTDKNVKENLLYFITIGYLPFAELNKTSITFKTASSEALPYDTCHSVSSSGYTKKVLKSALCVGCHAPLYLSEQSIVIKEDTIADVMPEEDDQDAKDIPSKDDTVNICIYCGTKSLL